MTVRAQRGFSNVSFRTSLEWYGLLSVPSGRMRHIWQSLPSLKLGEGEVGDNYGRWECVIRTNETKRFLVTIGGLSRTG